MILTANEISSLIKLTQLKTVSEFDGYKVVVQGFGYEGDPDLAGLQGKLSIMLQMASMSEASVLDQG